MSGYDALDELYERLRETEDARRAGGITPETIRAARGGVADVDGREYRETCENAADGDSAPLAGDSRDTRERIEADAWEAARLDMSRTWEERRDAIVALLDRQAALTEREWDSATANERIAELQAKLAQCMESYADARDSRDVLRAERDELQAELDEYDQTHMLLPVDADGVPIRVGDKMKYADGTKFEVDGIGSGGTLFSVDDGSNSAWWTNAEGKRHVEPRLLEDVLRKFGERVCRSGHQWGLDAPEVVSEYAAELRELMGVDDCNGWVGYDGVLRCADKSRHVKPRTVEDVLREFAQEMNENLGMYTGEVIDADEWRDADSETVKKYAAEIRELKEVDE